MNPFDPYRDGDLYDAEYAELALDIEHYATLAAEVPDVLELGCGTGRLTVPMARSGARVVAVDRAEGMLAVLRRRVSLEPLPVDIVHADVRELALDRRFPLTLLPFNIVHHFHTEAEPLGVFAVAREHTQPGGLFAMDAMVPDVSLVQRNPNRRYAPRVLPDPQGGLMDTWETGSYEPVKRVVYVNYHYCRANGTTEEIRMALKAWTPRELMRIAARAGFERVVLAGDFEGKPLRGSSKRVVALFERPAG